MNTTTLLTNWRRSKTLMGIVLACLATCVASGQTRTLRIAAYNIESDITLTNYGVGFINAVTTNTIGPPLPGLIAPPTNGAAVQLGGSLEGIGEEVVQGNAQPVDVVALEETTSNTNTVAPIVNGLNTFYGVPGMYSNSPYQAVEEFDEPDNGNGPNALVYNTRTLQLLSSVPVDPTGGTNQLGPANGGDSGEYREVMRYQLAPAGIVPNTNNTFYIYVSHYKSGTGSTPNNTNSRAGEAFIVRSNMVTTLPANARILHVGDFNTGDASESMYATLTAPGTNRLIDPLNPARSLTTNFDGSLDLSGLTEDDYYLEYRDDYQLMTTNVYYGATGGLALVPGTFHAFGNNGSVAYKGNVSSGSDTALNNLVTNGPVFISATQVYIDLTGAADHLPVVADYTVPLPTPTINGLNIIGTNLLFNFANCVTGQVYTVMTATNLKSPNWIPVATNISPGTSFTLTVTNVFNLTTPASFYQLQMP
jgi:hypothetical protein